MKVNFELHSEITCPYCRVGFGGVKVKSEKPKLKWFMSRAAKRKAREGIKMEFQHLDIFWSFESGLIVDCKNAELLKVNLDGVDERGNPKFKPEFEEKLKQLKEKYDSKPDDIRQDTCEWNDFHILFANALNWGMIDGDDEEFDRESIKWEDVEIMYKENKSLYDILRHYIVEIKEK